MIQTDTHRATVNNTLSKEQEESITLCQGHSRETSRRFYEIQDKERAAIQSVTAHQVLYGKMPDVNIRKISSEDEEFRIHQDIVDDVDDDDDDDDDGTSKCKRIRWTQNQEEWIINWMEKCKNNCLSGRQLNWKKCLNDMKTDDMAINIFTPAHHDICKLREFGKRLNKKRKLSVNELRMMR